MDMLGLFRQPVQLFDGNPQEHGHLVQEGSGAPGTVAVHPQVTAAVFFDIHDFGVFPANVDQGGYVWIFGFDEFGSGDYFLFKGNLELFRHPHAHGTGDLQLQAGTADLGTQSLQLFPQDPGHVGLVPLVAGKHHMGMIVQHDDLARGGPDV